MHTLLATDPLVCSDWIVDLSFSEDLEKQKGIGYNIEFREILEHYGRSGGLILASKRDDEHDELASLGRW